MKKSNLKLLMLILVGSMTFSLQSCNKEGCTDEAATNYDEKAKEDDGSCEYPSAATPENPQPTPSDADGVFIALNTVTYTSAFGFSAETAIGVPVAFALNGDSFYDMGTVTCESEELEKHSNNSYVYAVGAGNATGVEYDTEIDWEVTGSSDFSQMSQSVSGTFPSEIEIVGGQSQTISTDDEFTLETVSSVVYADSIIFAIYGPDGHVLVTEPGNVSAHTFTAAEMATLGKGYGFAQITGYRYAAKRQLTGGETVYFINEKVNTVAVTLE